MSARLDNRVRVFFKVLPFVLETTGGPLVRDDRAPVLDVASVELAVAVTDQILDKLKGGPGGRPSPDSVELPLQDAIRLERFVRLTIEALEARGELGAHPGVTSSREVLAGALAEVLSR